MTCVLVGESELKSLNTNRLRFTATMQTITFSVGGPTVFFFEKKQPRRDHFEGVDYHISHLVGVRTLIRLIKAQVVRRLGAE
ncbi:unnamed protein product [Ixodes persulcatus]